jgi:hypothetical protein
VQANTALVKEYPDKSVTQALEEALDPIGAAQEVAAAAIQA